ncbi:uncharacterized protein [Triticum aestivum]|uniref:uncharacterized protein isoform X1 n=1 Tax=Triticum aestivum TaxID=4565 RepID=UPI001D00515C|nr:uncharacterized protein LOC123071011 isoform X1 [Triticum aestivum]
MPTDLWASRSSTSSPSSSSAASPHSGVHRPGDEREKRTPLSPGGKRRRRLAAIGPRARWAREWDRAYLLACAAGLMVDPLFLYAVSVSGPLMCVFLDGWFAAAVTALRCMVDALHAWNLLLRLRMACAPGEEEKEEADADEEAQRVGGGAAAARLPRSKKGGLLLDVFVILPVMQVVMWVGIPAMIRAGSTTSVMTVLMVAFLFEYLPKIYHSVRFLRRMQNVAGYIFGTIWWGIALNLMAYFVAAHAVGACWYLLGAQRATKCLREQYCAGRVGGCAAGALACAEPLYYGGAGRLGGAVGADRLAWGRNASARATCLDSGDNYQYGAYKWTVMLVANPSRLEKILLPIFWGLMTLSEHDGVVGDSVQHHHHHRRPDPRHHAHREHQGVPERDHVQEAGDAHAAAERGVVDEAQEPAAELPAPGAAARAAAVGGDARRRRVPHRARPPRGPPPGHQVPPLPRPRPPGAALPPHGRPGAREHLRQGQVPRLPQGRSDREGRRPGAEDAVHRAGAPAEQPGAAERRDELLHAGAGQLQRGRAAVVVPKAAVPGAAAGGVLHAGDAGEHGGVRAGGGGRQVRDAALPLHLRQREGAAQRALLLARVAHLGRRRGAARVAPLQAPQDAHLALLHPPTAAAVQVLLARGGEAAALHRAAHLAQAQPGRPAPVRRTRPLLCQSIAQMQEPKIWAEIQPRFQRKKGKC